MSFVIFRWGGENKPAAVLVLVDTSNNGGSCPFFTRTLSSETCGLLLAAVKGLIPHRYIYLDMFFFFQFLDPTFSAAPRLSICTLARVVSCAVDARGIFTNNELSVKTPSSTARVKRCRASRLAMGQCF